MGANAVNQLIHTEDAFKGYLTCYSLDFTRHTFISSFILQREQEQSGELRRLFFIIAEGISELVGTMFTVKYFAQASLPLLPQALPHILQRTCST